MAAETIAGSHAPTPARRSLTLAHLDSDTLSATDVAHVLHFAGAASAANTRVAYDADWRAFVAWCAERDTTPLPCPPGLLCAYLSSLAKTDLRPSTIGPPASGGRQRSAGAHPASATSTASTALSRRPTPRR